MQKAKICLMFLFFSFFSLQAMAVNEVIYKIKGSNYTFSGGTYKVNLKKSRAWIVLNFIDEDLRGYEDGFGKPAHEFEVELSVPYLKLDSKKKFVVYDDGVTKRNCAIIHDSAGSEIENLDYNCTFLAVNFADQIVDEFGNRKHVSEKNIYFTIDWSK